MQKLQKDNFLFSYNKNGKSVELDLIKLDAINKSHYHAILVAHDANGKITTKKQTFKEKEKIQFTEVSHPIFCLIIANKNVNYYPPKGGSFVNA